MRRTLLTLSFVLLVWIAGEASAQCIDCYWDSQGCASCVNTNYNAGVLCTIENNGYLCRLQGGCEGERGDCRDPLHVTEARPERELKPQRQWQLVAVEIIRVDERKRRS